MPNDLASAPTEDVSLAAHPYRPAARFAVAVAAILVVAVALWFGWSAIARHRLRREIDALRAAGEPTRAEDFPNPPLADADNAAIGWRAAAAGVSSAVDCPANSNLTWHGYPPYPPEWWAAARGSEAANAAVFPQAHAAAGLRVARWLPGPTVATSNPMAAMPYNAARCLANVLADSAQLAHFGGHDDGRCLDRLGDLLQLSDAVDQQPSLISRLVAIGIRAMASNRVMIVAPDLDVGVRGIDRRQRVRSLIGQLLDDRPPPNQVLPLRAEVTAVILERAATRSEHPVLGPLVDLSASRSLHRMALDLRAAEAADAPAAAAIYAADPEPNPPFGSPAGPPRLSRTFDVGSAGDRYIETEWRVRAECRAAAVALAVRLYRADHNGHWPSDLSSLVPDELSAVPLDPLAGGSHPIGYVVRADALPDGGDRPLLIFGTRPVDVATATVPGEPSFGWSSRRKSPQWRDLARWAPTGDRAAK